MKWSSEDEFIADLVVRLNAGQIKSGAPCRSERTATINFSKWIFWNEIEINRFNIYNLIDKLLK